MAQRFNPAMKILSDNATSLATPVTGIREPRQEQKTSLSLRGNRIQPLAFHLRRLVEGKEEALELATNMWIFFRILDVEKIFKKSGDF